MQETIGLWGTLRRGIFTVGGEFESLRESAIAPAFETLIDEYQNRVFGYVRRMVPTGEDAEDLTQEVFVRAFQSYDRFDHRGSLKTWLFRIAHNLCVDRARRSGRRLDAVSLSMGQSEVEEYEVPDHRWQPDVLLENAEAVEMVELGIREMSEKLRSVLLLHDREELSYEEIGKALGIPVGTVKSRLFLARDFLKKRLSPFFDPEAA